MNSQVHKCNKSAGILNSQNPLSPSYRIEIKSAAQARIYNRILKVKIVVQVAMLAGLLALCGWNPRELALGLLLAVIWKGTELCFKSQNQ